MNGINLCARLFEEWPGIRTLLMSGSDVGQVVVHDANLAFLPKPFDGQNLRARVWAILAVSLQTPNH
jgi:DNA-binding response OmpR family regulator